MQRCQNAKIFMESNDVGTYLDGWGLSVATQRAKERENRTPGAKVMAENVKCTRLILGGAGARGWKVRAPEVVRGKQPGGAGARGLGCGHPGWSAGMVGGSGCPGCEVRVPGGVGFGRKFVGKWKKLVDFVEGKGEMERRRLDPLETKQIHGSNPTKPHQANKIQKNWTIFGGEFSNLGKNTQN